MLGKSLASKVPSCFVYIFMTYVYSVESVFRLWMEADRTMAMSSWDNLLVTWLWIQSVGAGSIPRSPGSLQEFIHVFLLEIVTLPGRCSHRPGSISYKRGCKSESHLWAFVSEISWRTDAGGWAASVCNFPGAISHFSPVPVASLPIKFLRPSPNTILVCHTYYVSL